MFIDRPVYDAMNFEISPNRLFRTKTSGNDHRGARIHERASAITLVFMDSPLQTN